MPNRGRRIEQRMKSACVQPTVATTGYRNQARAQRRVQAHLRRRNRGSLLALCGPLLSSLLGGIPMVEGQHTSASATAGRVTRTAAVLLECASKDVVVRELSQRFFRTWSFWRAEDDCVPPRVAFVAADAARVLPVELADGFAHLVESEHVRLPTDKDAVEYVEFLLYVAKPLAVVLRSAGDVAWVDDAARAKWGTVWCQPKAAAENGGYALELWLLESGDLIRAQFVIDPRGAIHPVIETVAPGVGLSISIE
jgi:hypothetical protein